MINKKTKIFLIISLIISLLLVIFISVKEIQIKKNNNEAITNLQNECLSTNYIGTEKEEFCISILNKDNKIEFFELFQENIINISNTKYMFIFIILTIITASVFNCSYLKNRILITELPRSNFKKIKKKMFLNSYISSLILLFIALSLIIIPLIYTKNLSSVNLITSNASVWSFETLKNPYLFLILYVLNIFFCSLIYINITLLVCRYHHNLFITIILSFLSIIGLEIVLEVFFGGIICTYLLKTDISILFNIINEFLFCNDSYGILSMMIVPFTIMIITFMMVYLAYKDKEKLIMDIEENE